MMEVEWNVLSGALFFRFDNMSSKGYIQTSELELLRLIRSQRLKNYEIEDFEICAKIMKSSPIKLKT